MRDICMYVYIYIYIYISGVKLSHKKNEIVDIRKQINTVPHYDIFKNIVVYEKILWSTISFGGSDSQGTKMH